MEEARLGGLRLVLSLVSATALLLGRGLVSAVRLLGGRGQGLMVGFVGRTLLDLVLLLLLQYLGNLQHLGTRGAF